MKNILRCYGEIYDIEMARAEGCYLYDSFGRRYTDFEAGVWCAALGHSHPAVTEVVCAQSGRMMHLGYRYKHPAVTEAAGALLDLCGMAGGRAIFLSSGSEAVEFMVQAARRVTGRQMMIYLRGTYLSAFGSAGMRRPEEWHEFDWRYCNGCQRGTGSDCPALKQLDFDAVAGLVFEAGSSRVEMPPIEALSCLDRKLREHGGLVLANEVTTGFGRTGRWFGFEHYGLLPDMVATGKGMGNGYPVSAVALSGEVAQSIEDSGVRYAQSHQNDALGCAVVLKVISALREEALVTRAAVTGRYLLEGLNRLVHQSPHYSECRGRGLMLMLQLSAAVTPEEAARMHENLFRSGYLVGYSHALHAFRLFPPLTVSQKDCDELLAALSQASPGS